jgi:SAM-dependent methyltransferase
MSNPSRQFDPAQYKSATRDQWNRSGSGYNAWGHTLRKVIEAPSQWMIDQAAITSGSRVLELAAGPGGLTLQLAARVGAEGKVLATDISPGILAFAGENAKAAGFGNVEIQEMDAEQVDVPEASFDAALSSLGLMFLPDPVKSVDGQRRAVRPGGRVAALVISTPERNPFFSVPAKVIRERAGLPPPQPGMPGPFVLGAPGAAEAVFGKTGLKDVQSRSFAHLLELPSVSEFIRFLGEAFGALHMMMTSMDDAAKQATWDAVAEALAPFDGADGFRCPYEVIACVGTR